MVKKKRSGLLSRSVKWDTIVKNKSLNEWVDAEEKEEKEGEVKNAD